MVINKSKRAIEKIAGIFNIIHFVIASIILIATCIFIFKELYLYNVLTTIIVLALLIELLLSFSLALSVRIMRNPFLPDNTFIDRTKDKKCLIVLMFCSLNFVSATMMLIANDLPDFIENNKVSVSAQQSNNNSNKTSEYYNRIRNLKDLKNSSIIDEKTTRSAIKKIIVQFLQEN